MNGSESSYPPAAEATGAPDPWRGRILLAIARDSLREAFGLGTSRRFEELWLREPGATFVTLRKGGELRGCVGSIHAHRPLGEDVRINARSAAFADTRFPPLAAAELPVVSLEVSLLSPAEPLDVRSEEEALAAIRPGIDGLILELGQHRSTFLPQVWEQLPDRREFLAHLKHKAGLPPAFWSPDVRLWRYTVAKWEEKER